METKHPLLSKRKSLEERLLAGCIKTEGCWIWRRSVASSGYGQIRLNYKNLRANRASFMVFKGEIPDGMVIRHTCDNKLCINPDHLILGSCKQNSEDMVSRDRQAKGIKNGRCKLSEDTVREIKKSTLSCSKTAEKFGISKSHAHKIMKGAAWSFIK
ncbi:HNH endonuclease signature motif containing protein [Citrobacter werkmanii]|uniref:HNH endonuclease signature motif containing protein n=1 Tax=Citrobacter werkmanii TaxID=67827 RepID=UPI002549C626|nr:HNH endonuclease signature motif containing protein [Citrobacter werkmanii]